MSTRSDLVYVRHILQAIGKIQVYVSDQSEADFATNSLVQDAVVRQFEIIGEAAKQVSLPFRDQHPKVPWSHMAKMRDLLIHHYWEVDLKIVWTTIHKDLPDLIPLLSTVLPSE